MSSLIISCVNVPERKFSNDFDINKTIKDNPFIRFDSKNKNITFDQGLLNVKNDIVIPAGYKVFIKEGTQLTFGSSSVFLSSVCYVPSTPAVSLNRRQRTIRSRFNKMYKKRNFSF